MEAVQQRRPWISLRFSMICPDCWVCRYGCDDDPPHSTHLQPPHSRDDLGNRQSGPVSERKIPRPTIRSWLHWGIPDLVACDLLSAEKAELLAELQELGHRAAALRAIVGLLVAMFRVSERQLDRDRLPEDKWETSAAPGAPPLTVGHRELGFEQL